MGWLPWGAVSSRCPCDRLCQGSLPTRPYDAGKKAKRGRGMNILILGGGGREHALAWAVRQNPKCDRLIVAPGNAGIAMLAECADLDILRRGGLLFCEENAIDFVIIGPEAPLAAGVADALRGAGC
jgi:phosphoribosylamine--glycine ligase